MMTSNGISIGLWLKFYTMSIGGGYYIFQFGASGLTTEFGRSSGANFWWVRTNDNNNIITMAIDSTSWQFVMLTIDYVNGTSSVYRMYINGVLAGSATHSYPVITNITTNLICTSPLEGWIGSVYVFTQTLSITQVQYLYNKDSVYYLHS